jgi:uncharacterized protein (TIGR01777 family)
MNLLVSGHRGLIGSALSDRLRGAGHSVIGLSRTPKAGELGWNFEAQELARFDAIVHLGGESIAGGRWTGAKKAELLSSRVDTTAQLAQGIASLTHRPNVFVVASAIGFYGHRPGEVLGEESASGGGFLAEVCRQWEAAAEPARSAGVRTVHTRFGVVLSPRGGALQKLLLPSRLGLGGPIGDGRQMWSWVALDDVAGAILHALTSESLSGPINVVAPNPVSQSEFARVLGRVLRRPAIMPLPAPAARLILGQMAEEMLLASQNVRPAKLLDSSYAFAFTELEPALRAML